MIFISFRENDATSPLRNRKYLQGREFMDKKCYAIVKNSGYSLIKLETVLDFAGCKAFLEDTEKLIEENNHVLVDCEHVVELPKDLVS